MTNPSNLVITGLDGYFILNFLQKSGYYHVLLTASIIFVHLKQKSIMAVMVQVTVSYMQV